MTHQWRQWPWRRRAERLLDGAADGTAVSEALDAARRPGSPDELAREDVTVAMFQQARRDDLVTAVSGHADAPRRVHLKSLVAGVAVIVFATGGVALASTGHVPWPPLVGSSGAAGEPSDGPGPGSDEIDPVAPATPLVPESAARDASPSSSLRGLCRSYLATNGAERQNDRFAALIRAAGAAADVEAYCAERREEKVEQAEKAAKPAKPAKPDKAERSARPDKPEKSAKSEKAERSGKPDKPEKSAKPDKAEKSDKATDPAE